MPDWMRFFRASYVVGVARPGVGNNAIKGLQDQCPDRVELVDGCGLTKL